MFIVIIREVKMMMDDVGGWRALIIEVFHVVIKIIQIDDAGCNSRRR